MNDLERISELEAQVQQLERELAQMQQLRREAVAARDLETARLRNSRDELGQLRRRLAVRVALGLSNRTQRIGRVVLGLVSVPRRAASTIRRRRPRRGTPDRGQRTPGAERELGAAIRQGLTPSTVERGPLVSIVILDRDGRPLLERCLAAVARTTYQDIEIIVVDDSATDASSESVEGLELRFPLRVVRNEENWSFSDANDGAAAVAQGELLCFLDDNVEPITDGWLGYMVETLTTTSDAVAVGARLISPSNRGGKRAAARFADLTLRHRGMDFDRAEAVPMPRAMGAGEDPRTAEAVAVDDRPALTAACLLVRKEAFDAVGGFGSTYDDGLEDVDLCLNLRAAGGRIVYDGRAALWQHESATRAADPVLRRSRAARNREAYLDAWGPRIFREALLDALDGGRRYSSAPFHVAVIGSHDLGDTLRPLGWHVSRSTTDTDGTLVLDPSVEAVIVVDDEVDIRELPRRLISLAWIRADPGRWVERPWFNDYDVVLAFEPETVALVRERSSKVATAVSIEPTAGSIRDAVATWATAIRYGLRIGAPSRDVVDHWGDYHFARALQRSLERSGHPTKLHLLPDWVEPIAARDDVTVHLFGLKEAPTRRSQVNLLWQISHPDLASPELYERYDHAFVASDRFAARMRSQVTVPVTPLHQATDPERFLPEPTGPAHELLFVGNSRNVRRRIVDDVVASGHEIAVYGTRWRSDLVDPRFVKGTWIPNAELNRYYSSAAIVLNDHWGDMLAEGFISNRIYDALACGAFVISDYLPELDAEFDDAVVSYTDRSELGPLIDRYLADPDERRVRGARGRAAVLARHTFDDRVRVLQETVSPLLAVARSR